MNMEEGTVPISLLAIGFSNGIAKYRTPLVASNRHHCYNDIKLAYGLSVLFPGQLET
jgi:hypothetical protein